MARPIEKDEKGYIKDGQKKFIRLEKPKHPECLSTEECAYFQPWKVILKVEPTEEDSYDMDFEPVDYEVYCRAPNPNDAFYTAIGVFEILNHGTPETKLNEFPRICEYQDCKSEAIKLSESQYKEFWREAQAYPHWPTNIPVDGNPTIFWFRKPGWNLTGGRAGHGNASIIMPDKAGIQSVAGMKQMMDQKFKKNGKRP